MHSLLDLIATCIEGGRANRFSNDPPAALQSLSAECR